MNTCCEPLLNLIEMAGEKGIAIIAMKNNKQEPRLYLQARAMEKGVTIVATQKDGSAASVSILSQIPIKNCPSCGSDLKTLIIKNRTYFESLADDHDKWSYHVI